jgi:hypothetical protein
MEEVVGSVGYSIRREVDGAGHGAGRPYSNSFVKTRQVALKTEIAFGNLD